MILTCVYIWKLCFGHFSQYQHGNLAPAADIEKKALPISKSVQNVEYNLIFQMAFWNKFLEAVNPTFDCLILYVWWCVLHCNLMHIGPKFGKIQPIQCALRNKIAPCLLQHKIFMHFFAFWTKHILRKIATAAWIIIKAIIKLYSDYAVFKCDGSMLKTCSIHSRGAYSGA